MLYNNVVYTIGGKLGNSILKYAYQIETGELIPYSSDYLSIRKYHKDKIISHHKMNACNKTIETRYEGICINFISSFTRGTVHGYVTIWEYIMYFLKMKLENNNFKVVLCHNTQQGIKDIVYYFVDKKNIIFLDMNKQYILIKYILLHIKKCILAIHFNKYFNHFIEQNIISTTNADDFKLKPNILILKVKDVSNCINVGIFNKKEFCRSLLIEMVMNFINQKKTMR